jgi:hypothetical protein
MRMPRSDVRFVEASHLALQIHPEAAAIGGVLAEARVNRMQLAAHSAACGLKVTQHRTRATRFGDWIPIGQTS